MRKETQGGWEARRSKEGAAQGSLCPPLTCSRQAQLLLISKSDGGGEIQPSPGHGRSPEQPASAKPERSWLGPQETCSCCPALGSLGHHVSAVVGSDEREG